MLQVAKKKFRCPSGDCNGIFYIVRCKIFFGKCSDDIFKNTIGHFNADDS